VFKKERDVGDRKFQNWCEIHYFSIIERGKFPIFMNIYGSLWLISAELFMFIYACHIASNRHHGRVANVFPSDSGGLWFLSQPVARLTTMEIVRGFPQFLTAILGSSLKSGHVFVLPY
jgi:hypothetical protein